MKLKTVYDADAYERFVIEARPRLQRALVGHIRLRKIPDAVSEALAWAWQTWPAVEEMDAPLGYLFRVAQSKSRSRRGGFPAADAPKSDPHIEPRLAPAMKALPLQQRSSVWLVCACGWTYAETAAAMGISASAVGTHVARGLSTLRERLGVNGE